MSKPLSVLLYKTSTLVSPEEISFGHARIKAKQLIIVSKAFAFVFIDVQAGVGEKIAINATLSDENIHLGHFSFGISSTLVSFAEKPSSGFIYQWRTFGFLLMSKPSVMLRITPTVSHG